MQMNNLYTRFLIIGEVYTDVHLDIKDSPVRLGGIFHSARTFNSINVNYALASIAPKYLFGSIEKYSDILNCQLSSIIGEINGASNVITINDSPENGHQGYNDILRDQADVMIDIEELNRIIEEYKPTDIIVYPGKYNIDGLLPVLKSFKGKIHIDVQYVSEGLQRIISNEIKLETLILSTSSNLFKENDFSLLKLVNSHLFLNTNSFLLKENRGGSTYFDKINNKWFEAPAFKTETVHSVGVGDCFNAVFLFLKNLRAEKAALKIASYISMLYASNFVFDVFKDFVRSLDFNELETLIGRRLPWEERQKHHIYLAGPDFPDVDAKFIELLYNNLSYHNFSPHRPVLENGLITGNESPAEQEVAYRKDITLLEKSSLLIGVILNDDPGTYVEIGWMSKSGKPVIIFDPYKQVRNLFLKKSANYIVHTIHEVIDLVFDLLGKKEQDIHSEEYDALLLVSGGLDSTVLAYKLLSEGKKILPVFLRYNQHFVETEYKTLLDVLPSSLIPNIKVINIEDIYINSNSRMIIEPNLWVDDVTADDLYLPYRNLLFLSIASSIAQTLGIKNVYSAFINSNHAKEIDCSKEFFDSLSEVLSEYGTVQIQMPFRDFSKADVINLGLSLNVPIAKTYSCQANSLTPCGVCPNCVDRIDGFKNALEMQGKLYE